MVFKKVLTKLRKGGGELVGYSVSVICIVQIIALIIGFVQFGNVKMRVNNAVMVAGRDIAVCTSRAEAEETAYTTVYNLLRESKLIDMDTLNVTVEFYNDEDSRWQKGNYVVVKVEVWNKNTPLALLNGAFHTQELVMIERVTEE